MQEVNPNDFDQKPFLRLFSSILNDLKVIELENASLYRKLLFLMSESFYTLQPLNVPAFSFSWIQLISHRNFLSSLLLVNGHEVLFFHGVSNFVVLASLSKITLCSFGFCFAFLFYPPIVTFQSDALSINTPGLFDTFA
jgi:hypothetical protein